MYLMIKCEMNPTLKKTLQFTSSHRRPGENQSIPDHSVEHGEDIEGTGALGSHKPWSIPYHRGEGRGSEGWVSLCGAAISPQSLVWECAGVTRSPCSASHQHSSTSLAPNFSPPRRRSPWQRVSRILKGLKWNRINQRQVSKSCPDKWKALWPSETTW